MNFEKMFNTIDTHVAGEAFRIVLHSSITLLNESIESADRELQRSFDIEKNLLLNEPRGHRGINGCIVLPSKEADYRLLFFNHKDVSNFKYEGVLASVTALLETGNLKRNENDVYKIETIHGIYTVKTTVENQEVTAVYIESKGCLTTDSNNEYVSVSVEGSRNYLLFNLPESIQSLELKYLAAINNWGMKKTKELKNTNIIFDGVVLIEPSKLSPNKVCSLTFEKDGYILRSPGIDSTFAIHASVLSEQKEIINESIFNSSLTTKVLMESDYRFSVETEAFVTGSHEFIFDQDDPLKVGFLLA